MLTSLDTGAVLTLPCDAVFRPERTVCITGHREKSITPYKNAPENIHITRAAVKLMLFHYIDMAVEKGYTDFFSGLAQGTDLWAAEYVLLKKQNNDNIRLIGAMPYLKHSRFFSSEERRRLCDVENGADSLVLVCSDTQMIYGRKGKQGTSSELYKDRNYFMVDNSSAVLAFFDEASSFSGTAQTVNYARKTGRKIHSFGLDDVFELLDRSGANFRNIGKLVKSLDIAF